MIALLVAAANDLLFHKIPNWLTYSTMIVAVTYYTYHKGLDGLLFSVGGIGLGMAVLIIRYKDVKKYMVTKGMEA
jgi:prepilin peptidase CpaA